MTTTPKAYCLLSGGLDSTTALARAISQYGASSCAAVSIDYGQRHLVELRAASVIAEAYGVSHTLLRMEVPRTMLTDPSIPVPDISYAEIQGVSPTFVPFRNGLMLSTIASHIAGIHLDPTREGTPDHGRDAIIYWGAHAEDAAGWAYPDCTPEFIGAMACAIYIGSYHKIRVVAPFASMMKHEIVSEGIRLGVDYRQTWSCYRGGTIHCGVCATCRARKDAFTESGESDPTLYAG